MDWGTRIIFLIICTASFYYSNACQIEGANWPVPMPASVIDTYRGNILNRSTTNIEGINSISYGEVLNSGPYVDIELVNSRILISTKNEAFEMYEENETTQMMPVTVTFACTGGSTMIFTFMIEVIDTNNNAPRFMPSNEFVFTISPPVPPGFEVTGCFNDLIVRDIDLTTQRIDFAITDNPYFEIEYDADSSTTAKEFQAKLRTTTFIRNIPEPITFTITATDVDLTGDDPLTTSATVIIHGNTDFELPEEPVFSEAFYLANYTTDDQVVLAQPISLRSGYDDLVEFTIHGEYSNNFELERTGNQGVSVHVVAPLAAEILTEKQIFLVVRADREHTSGDSATIIVHLPEDVPLEFERAHYEGSIENNSLQVPQLTLSRGYEGASISAAVLNEHSTYFAAVVEENTITLSMTLLDESVVNENSFIFLQIVASTDRSTATTIVTLEIIKDDNVTPVFNSSIYNGSYDPDTGLTLEQMVLVQGYDETVSVSLEGDYAGYFEVARNGAIVTLNVSTIPPEIYSEGPILLSIEVTKRRTVGANAAVIITLPAARELEFEASTYRGSLKDNALNLEPIMLRVGYDDDIDFSLTGEHASHFSVSNEQSQVTISLMTPIPSSIILENNIVILTLAASGLNAVTTTTSVLLDIIKDDVTTPVFTRNIYYGTYQAPSIINVEDITLVQGFSDGVTFRLSGDHAQYFEISNTSNNVVLSLRSSIPEDVIFNEKVLLFTILAEKALTVGASAAISIRFPSELTDSVVMRFTQNTYTGTIDSNALTVDNIILSSGYAAGTEFVLTGDYSAYFTLTNTTNVVSLSLLNPLPIDTVENRFIVLEIEARRVRAVSVWASVVIDVIKQEIVSPVFTEAYYRGVYNADSGLQFNEVISLYSGYDETVIFRLEGEFAPLFALDVRDNNSLSIVAPAQISEEIIKSNNHLLFTVVASKQGADALAAISIDIEKGDTNNFVLGFDQVTYTGYIENNTTHIGPITLVEGYTEDVTFGLYRDLSSYFDITRVGSVVNVAIQTPIPAALIPANRIIVLEIRASAPQAVNAFATIVFEVIAEDDASSAVNLVFDAPYYTGSYNVENGLVLDTPITLSEGYDNSVQFALEGENAQWFSPVQVQNSVTLIVSSAIPDAVLTNNHQLVFLITAQRQGSATVRATIVISLTDEHTEGASLGFDRVTYLGSIQNNATEIGPITLVEGYTDDVTFGLYGDLSSYFDITRVGSVVNVAIQTPIPAALIPANRIIVLEIRASAPQAVNAFATIVFEIIAEDDASSAVNLVFDAPYYTGSYNVENGLVLDTPITLFEGYDNSVQFALEGENAQWFSPVQVQNSVTLIVSSAIPDAVLTNNHQLVFLITAQRQGSATVRATIVISLTDEHTEGASLGFDRVTYLGSIQNNATEIGPITLVEGYTDDVTFGLYGDLSSYFDITRVGSVVNVAIQTPIPAALIPANRIIVLEIRASAPQAVNAFATIVFEVIAEDDASSAVNLVFDAPYYTGSYNVENGLVLDTPITLSEGYDNSVQFALEGENAQWFSPVQVQNSVTLIVSSAIPDAVLTNNHQLVFLITAQRQGSATVRATIVISLTDEHTEGASLGFDRVTYLGSIQNNATEIGPITLVEGYTDDVTFGLYGDLSSYFDITRVGSVVNVAIQTPIPAALIPANRIIVLEIRASAPQAVNAFATIVFEIIAEDDASSAVNLVFDAPYYTGSYNVENGLVLDTPITLFEGYDNSVQFALEGENAQWFSPVQVQNSVTLIVSSAIPDAVLTNNHQLVFLITAQRQGSATVRATIVISLTDEHTEGASLGFDRVTYLGSIQNNATEIGPITLVEGYTDDVTFGLYGDLSSYFDITRVGSVVNVAIQTPIPAALIPANRIIVLEIRASAPQAVNAFATIVFEVIAEDDASSAVNLVFDAPYYTGSYNVENGLVLDTPITLSEGYDNSVQFALEGENAQWFSPVQVQNSVTLIVSSAIPDAVLTNNHQLVFLITAQRQGSATVRATIVISLTDEHTEGASLGFDRVTYLGSIQNNATEIGPITLVEGYTDDVTFGLYGDLSSYFDITRVGSVVNVAIQTPIPAALIPANRIIVLEIRASAPQAVNAFATIVFEVIAEDDASSAVNLVFDAPFYTGSYNVENGLVLDSPITLSEGYDNSVQFALEGENAQWFSPVQVQNSVTLIVSSAIPDAVLTNNHQLVFLITAQRQGSATVRAMIVISLTDEFTEGASLGFDRVTYLGFIQNNATEIGPITLVEGYTDDVTFGLYGDLSSYFDITRVGSVVNVAIQTPIPAALIPANRIIVLEIRASAPQAINAFASIVFEVIVEDDVSSAVNLVFDALYYTGSYNIENGLVMESPITLSEGYDDSVQFALEGENAQWFSLVRVQNSVTLIVSSSIPGAILTSNHQLVFFITAQRPGSTTVRATIVITLTDNLQTVDDVSFEKVLYEGIIQLDEIRHESIVISGYDGTTVDVLGEHSSLFVAYVADEKVSVQASGSVTLPADVTQLALELHAAGARAVLLLNVLQADVPVLPSVEFSSESYVLNVEIVQTGFVGRVSATADNGEAVTYSLATEAHLQTRLSINNEGELYLSAPANSGVYTFQVIATTIITRARGTAMVYLRVEAVTVCGEDDIVVPPLIVIDRDEEEPHRNLVVLDPTQYGGCHFTLTNRWPVNQTWLYVDDTGLHTTAIDREHESIAFMALSQVQVELILNCETVKAIRTKRSERTDWLGPYDYGTNKWILTETISYNSRRSLVNLIVNDINDNAPIFVGKEQEPLAMGYPIAEVEERILPRSLAELRATDADVGVNAALVYWSSESVLAVAPTTGFVHVRSGARLQHDQVLTVSATDRDGEGLTGTIQLVVKLLDLNNIAVVTVKDAFLDDETNVLALLSDAVGYEVKTLRSVVISDDIHEDVTRKTRGTNTTGALLQLYVYGLIEREAVTVDRLTIDINNNAAIVSVISTISLEDHLLEDSPITILERGVGLLVATIVLSILLFILILLIAIWFFLKWRKNRNYDEFSDNKSLASRNASLGELPKPEDPKPRLNIEDLKKSERRLQEMLKAPIGEVTVDPTTSKRETPLESILDFPIPETNAPIVIQSIDKLKDADETDDEFGEKNETRRKSVVTFNENVEKIIHVEDDTDSSSHSGYEIYKL